MNTNDLLAYLLVLGCDRLDSEQAQTAQRHMLGCLVRLRDQLEAAPELHHIHRLLQEREYLNVRHPHGYPPLTRATNVLIDALLGYLHEQTLSGVR